MLDCSNVSVVIVSFRSEEALLNLLPSIPLECEIIVVNNDSPLPKKIKEIRNFLEILRAIDSMQLTANHKVATPADWKKGENVIILPAVKDDEAKKLFPDGWDAVKPYLRKVPDPSK